MQPRTCVVPGLLFLPFFHAIARKNFEKNPCDCYCISYQSDGNSNCMIEDGWGGIGHDTDKQA